jgi:predicted DNA-binding transcriptional regulator AlpA
MNFENEILTVDDLAALLKMKRSQIYTMTRHRARVRHPLPLPLLRINGNLRFRRTEIAKWLDQLAEYEQDGNR